MHVTIIVIHSNNNNLIITIVIQYLNTIMTNQIPSLVVYSLPIYYIIRYSRLLITVIDISK